MGDASSLRNAAEKNKNLLHLQLFLIFLQEVFAKNITKVKMKLSQTLNIQSH